MKGSFKQKFILCFNQQFVVLNHTEIVHSLSICFMLESISMTSNGNTQRHIVNDCDCDNVIKSINYFLWLTITLFIYFSLARLKHSCVMIDLLFDQMYNTRVLKCLAM